MAQKASVKIARNPTVKTKVIQKAGDKKPNSSKGKSTRRTRKAAIAKPGSKKDTVLALLRRKSGANI